MVTPPRALPAIPAPADVWMLVRQRPAVLRRSTRELAAALADNYGPRFAVWHTDELLFGVQGGRLVLRTLGGADLPAPEVVCVRQVAGPMRNDREVTLLRHLEHMGSTLINTVAAQLKSRNKVWQLQELALAGLPVPDTVSYATAPLEGVVRSPHLGTPCVVKSVSGAKGGQVFLAPDPHLLGEVAGSLTQEAPFLFQEHIAHSHGRTLRVIVVGGEPVDAVLHASCNGTLTANIAKGGSATLCAGRYPQAEQLAVRAARALGLDIAGVDLLFTSEVTFTICEVNAVPGWRPEMTAITPAITTRIAQALSARHRETPLPATGPRQDRFAQGQIPQIPS
ncbi:RimK family alpha-L-glutamate ligase [Streptomyces sp. KLMMK]|uniref:RimK family alpha-L-glutamate ligase n=1 Tax=Streptomyces sp. KLMMK TaxID=3109353 RepID=UPI00300BE5B5